MNRRLPEYPWNVVTPKEGFIVLIAALYFVAGWRSAVRTLRDRGMIVDGSKDHEDALGRLVRARHDHQQAAAALAEAERGI